MKIATKTYNQLRNKILPPPVWEGVDKSYDASRLSFLGVWHHIQCHIKFVSHPVASGFGPLRQVFLCLCVLMAVTGCENPDIPTSSPRMKELYFESCNLTQVQTDSIPRFAIKFYAYIAQNPGEKADPIFPDIRSNIHDAADKAGILAGDFLINTEWEGDTSIEF